MNDTTVRLYRKDDRPLVRNIAWETAFVGESAEHFFDGKEFFSDFLTLYFTDYEAQSSFVAERSGEVIGYLIGAKDITLVKTVFISKIFPRLLHKVFGEGIIFRKKNIVFLWNCYLSAFKGEFKEPDYSKEYPAVLHINIKKDFRGVGIGKKLMDVYLEYLSAQKVGGVRLATMSQGANQFFQKQGFSLLHQGKRSYFRYLSQKDFPIYTLGRKL